MQISNRALAKIQEVLSQEDVHAEFPDLVPVITWIENRSSSNDNPGPSLGLMERVSANKAKDFFANGKITVYNGLPDHLYLRFKQSTLDFVGNNFEFVDNVSTEGG